MMLTKFLEKRRSRRLEENLGSAGLESEALQESAMNPDDATELMEAAEHVAAFAEAVSEVDSAGTSMPSSVVLCAPDGWFDPELAEELRQLDLRVYEVTQALDVARLVAGERSSLIVADLYSGSDVAIVEIRSAVGFGCKLLLSTDWGQESIHSVHGRMYGDGCVPMKCSASDLLSAWKRIHLRERLC